VPVWMGMGWLATKSGQVPQSKRQTAGYPLIKLPRAELKLQSISRSSILLHQHQKMSDRKLDCPASYPSFIAFCISVIARLGFFTHE
jgi:hypothetical protein